MNVYLFPAYRQYPDIYYRKINSSAPWKKFISMQDEITTVNASGNKLFMVSKKNAPNGKILFMDFGQS